MRSPDHAAPAAPAGVNLIGHVTGPMGLGVAARNTLAMLDASGRRFTAIDIDAGGGRGGVDRSWQRAIASPPDAPHPVNWFQLNPPEIAALVAGRPGWLDPHAHANVCVPFWELPRLPAAPAWLAGLGAMDLVLAPSRFVLDAIRTSAPHVAVAHYPQTVILPDGIASRRGDFGLPSDEVLFHVAADASSDLERKNPVAAIRAFRAAFPEGGKVGLVVKLGQTRAGYAWADPAALLAEAAGHPGIHIVDRDLAYADALSLAASCDVCVSLHRSEGLGLGMLEAMTLGKPVIATAWSGNMDFTAEGHACLVGFDLVPVRARHPAYAPAFAGPGQVWAEPRPAEAVAWMRALAADAGLRAEIGGRARQAAEALRVRVLSGEVLAEVDRAVAAALGSRNRFRRRWRWRRFAATAAGGDLRARLRHAMQRALGRIRG